MQTAANISHKPLFWVALTLLAGAGLRAWLILGGWAPFNADEAIVGLMARHILQGARPVFFYGQAYMGSLDAFLIAGGFWLFGEYVWVIRLIQSLLFGGFLFTSYLLGREIFGKWQIGALATLLLAVPTVNLTLYTTVSLGGYGEALVIGNLILLCALQIGRKWRAGDFPAGGLSWIIFGGLNGLGFWAFGLTLIYSVSAAAYLTATAFQRSSQLKPPGRAPILTALSALIFGFILGSLPIWIYAAQEGFSRMLVELGGGAIAGVEGLPWLAQIPRHTLNLLVFGIPAALGLRPPWSASWLGLPLLPFVLVFWMAVILHAVKKVAKGPGGEEALLPALVMLTLAFGFVLSPFGADPSGRYFLPLAMPLALFAADMILSWKARYGRWALAAAVLVVAYQLWGTVQSALRFPPGLTTQFYSPSQIDHRYDQALIDFLISHEERRGYTNYWTAYPLAFLTEEKLIFTPRLPYHLDMRYTERDDRYAPYDALVENAGRAAYITSLHPKLDETLREQLSMRGISWEEAQIGDYRVFYQLSQPIRPEELGLGKTTQP